MILARHGACDFISVHGVEILELIVCYRAALNSVRGIFPWLLSRFVVMNAIFCASSVSDMPFFSSKKGWDFTAVLQFCPSKQMLLILKNSLHNVKSWINFLTETLFGRFCFIESTFPGEKAPCTEVIRTVSNLIVNERFAIKDMCSINENTARNMQQRVCSRTI